MHVYYKMDLLRQRQVFKQWFNKIDILKKWKYIEDNTLEWFIRKRKGRLFKQWRKQSRLQQMKFIVSRKHEAFQTRYWFKMIEKGTLLSLNYKSVSFVA